jgi:hypothetical protein
MGANKIFNFPPTFAIYHAIDIHIKFCVGNKGETITRVNGDVSINYSKRLQIE